MAISKTVSFAELDDLFLDPLNPRLGRKNTGEDVPQEKVLELMRGWTLEELATSFLESGFWAHEALIVVEEELYGRRCKVVIEGNRRLAALKLLDDAYRGGSVSRRFKEIAQGFSRPDDLFKEIPYFIVDSREEVEAFLGFRHVTGIKEWHPAEKAEYIAKLIDDRGMTYQEVMRKIGSKTEAVRRNYISYRILKQLEEIEQWQIEEGESSISLENVEEKFSVLFLSLREVGVQRFLHVDIKAAPPEAKLPVPADKLEDLASFAAWLFGTEAHPPLFTDSRNITKFGKVLESATAVHYLKQSPNPSFDLAIQKAGADEPEILDRIQRATDEIEQALGRVHLYLESEDIQKAVNRLGRGAIELIKKFPAIYEELIGEKK